MAVAPIRGGSDDAARAALGALLQHLLTSPLTRGVPAQAMSDGACDTVLCLTEVAQQACARYAVTVDWTGFGKAAVLTAHAWDARSGHEVVEVAARADSPEHMRMYRAACDDAYCYVDSSTPRRQRQIGI